MNIEEIIHCINPLEAIVVNECSIETLVSDTRKIGSPEGCLFIALKGPNFDGHDFLDIARKGGITNFLVSNSIEFEDCNILRVDDTLDALQKLTACKRNSISNPVVAVTGSNGKTIVKDWLSQVLGIKMSVCSNPLSYNSQVGVPLSVWRLNSNHEIGVFEAGISTTGEMDRLEKIIRPTLGVFTNLGSAHDDGFENRREKLLEKLRLFRRCEDLIYRDTQDWVSNEIRQQLSSTNLISWGHTNESDVQVVFQRTASGTLIEINSEVYETPFQDESFLENLTHCIVALLHLNINVGTIKKGISALAPVPMRLEIKDGINNSLIIDDTYNNDLTGITYAIDYLKQQPKYKRKSLILSDVINGEINNETFETDLHKVIAEAQLDLVILVGAHFYQNSSRFPAHWIFINSTEELLNSLHQYNFAQSVVLVKGARPFRFERIVFALQEKTHETTLEINLNALIDNLNWFRKRLKTTTKVMVMVKASAYGSGSLEIANTLQYNRVDYFGVAYTDEAVALRQSGIYTPILVLNAPPETVELLLQYDLEPEVYSISQLKHFISELNSQRIDGKLAVHLNIETGMNRLGVERDQLDELIQLLEANDQKIEVRGIMSHLAGSDAPEHAEFTKNQAIRFEEGTSIISDKLGIRPIRHLLNSAGIISYPDYQHDMVRLGIGLYGIDPTTNIKEQLTPVGRLTTKISQIKKVKAGETIGYSRAGVAHKDMNVATISIGYSDGFPRALSNGVGSVLVNGQEALVVGNVCMDMTMIDVTDVNARVGDEAIIFGDEKTIDQLAKALNTIPYEILTSVSDRVKRRFIYK